MINMNKSKYAISSLQLAKWSACIYVIVSKALIPLGYLNGIIQLIVLVLSTLMTVYMDRGKLRLNRFLVVEFVFIAITTVTSLLFAKSQSWVISSVQTLLYGFLFGYSVTRISTEEKSVDWFIKSWVVAGVIIVGYIFITGGYSFGRLIRITAREGMNPNTLGVYLMFAVWAVLYLMSIKLREKKSVIPSVITGIVFIALFLYVIIGTGSRKSFIASLLVILFWAVFAMIPTFREISIWKRLSSFVIAGAVIFFVYYRFGSTFSRISTTLTTRMQMISGENITDMHRFDLITDALRVFGQHPVFGVGWNNYRLYSFSSQYSHCTFVEVLACTGVIGSVFAYLLWGMMISRIWTSVRHMINKTVGVNMIALLLVFLFINVVQIMYYNSSLLMIMHLLVAFALVQNNRTVFEPVQNNRAAYVEVE